MMTFACYLYKTATLPGTYPTAIDAVDVRVSEEGGHNEARRAAAREWNLAPHMWSLPHPKSPYRIDVIQKEPGP